MFMESRNNYGKGRGKNETKERRKRTETPFTRFTAKSNKISINFSQMKSVKKMQNPMARPLK